MKKLFVGFVGLCLVGMMAFSAIGAEKKPLDQVTIGYVMPYNIGWFAYLATPEDYQPKLLPWQMDEKWIPIAEKFIRTGKLEY